MKSLERVKELLVGSPGQQQEMNGGFRKDIIDGNEVVIIANDAGSRERLWSCSICP